MAVAQRTAGTTKPTAKAVAAPLLADVRTAGRFALLDDYHTTAVRLEFLEQLPFPGDERE